jgi:hypothetical protein
VEYSTWPEPLANPLAERSPRFDEIVEQPELTADVIDPLLISSAPADSSQETGSALRSLVVGSMNEASALSSPRYQRRSARGSVLILRSVPWTESKRRSPGCAVRKTAKITAPNGGAWFHRVKSTDDAAVEALDANCSASLGAKTGWQSFYRYKHFSTGYGTILQATELRKSFRVSECVLQVKEKRQRG